MTAVAIFVKTPGQSPVKTRLAAAIGTGPAEALHTASARAVAEAARQAESGPAYWAVAEDHPVAGHHWPGLDVVRQGTGTLGERMCRVHTQLTHHHGSAILLGADTPQLDPGVLVVATEWLQRDHPRLVIGPASDGGFWLFGANTAIDPARWDRVTYSQADTCNAFRLALDGCGDWLTVDILTDLDRAEDIPPVLDELSRLSDPTPAQCQARRLLQQWLHTAAPFHHEMDP